MARFGFLLKIGLFGKSLREQQAVLRDYWQRAGHVLSGSGVTLRPVPARWLNLRHNYFSTLFIAVFFTLGIPLPRLRLYARLNHCLRAWVTSCDNLLDRELKEMLKTDLPAGAMVFKSVHTLLVTDRVYFSFLREAAARGIITEAEMERLLALSLTAVTASGLEEAGEEAGADHSLKPGEVLSRIHALKTGLLFTSPLMAPSELGDIKEEDEGVRCLRQGLFHFGIACQILDDLNDMGADLSDKKHNYLAALIIHGGGKEKKLLSDLLSSGRDLRGDASLYGRFPLAFERARTEMLSRFRTSLGFLSDGGLPLGGPARAAFVRALTALYNHPEIMGRLRSI